MKTRLAQSAVGLVLAGLVGSACAQHAPETAQQATYFGTDFMSVVNKDTAYPHAGLVHVKLDVYFFDPSSLYTPKARVDYIRYDAVVDCSKQGAWTATSWAAYREGSRQPVLKGADREGTWRADAEGSPGWANWNGICRDRFDESDITFPRSMPPEEVLKAYRQNIRYGS